MKPRLIAWCCAAAVALGVVVSVHQAFADTYPGETPALFPDAGPHWACWMPNPGTSTIPQPIWDHLFSYMNGSLNTATGVSVSWSNVCDTSIDMRLDDRLNDPTLYGVESCINSSGNTCFGADVKINYNTINRDADNAGVNRYNVQRSNWCHEAGHSLGLGHENNCMAQGFITDLSYSAHHTTHIDSRF